MARVNIVSTASFSSATFRFPTRKSKASSLSTVVKTASTAASLIFSSSISPSAESKGLAAESGGDASSHSPSGAVAFRATGSDRMNARPLTVSLK